MIFTAQYRDITIDDVGFVKRKTKWGMGEIADCRFKIADFDFGLRFADCGFKKNSGQRTAVLSPIRAERHMPSASLGQYASLSFVVRGRGHLSVVRGPWSVAEKAKRRMHEEQKKS
jgi:hypothetical protein